MREIFLESSYDRILIDNISCITWHIKIDILFSLYRSQWRWLNCHAIGQMIGNNRHMGNNHHRDFFYFLVVIEIKIRLSYLNLKIKKNSFGFCCDSNWENQIYQWLCFGFWLSSSCLLGHPRASCVLQGPIFSSSQFTAVQSFLILIKVWHAWNLILFENKFHKVHACFNL